MSITRPPQRLARGPILIGLAAIAIAALLPAAALGGKTSHHLEFRLSAVPHQDMVGESAIEVRARCLSESCAVVASARSKDPSLHTGTTHATIASGEAVTLTMPLAKKQRGKLKAALEAGKSPVFTVKAAAHDRAGTRIPLEVRIQAQNP